MDVPAADVRPKMPPTHIHFGFMQDIEIAGSWHIFLQRLKNRESFPYKNANRAERCVFFAF